MGGGGGLSRLRTGWRDLHEQGNEAWSNPLMYVKFVVYRVEYVIVHNGLPGITATEEANGAEFLVVNGAKIQEQSTCACPQASSRRRRRPICTSPLWGGRLRSCSRSR